MVTPKPQGGRPPLAAGGSTPVSVRLANTTYDELYACASTHGIDIAVLIREAIEQRLVHERRQAAR